MNKRGQSIIEYTLIAILVILGIVYMGPYVLRSVNSYFKLWDAGVQDSFEENLSQAPVNAIPNITSNCVCTAVDEGCGSTTVGGCPPGYRQSTHSCTPQGCDYSASGSTCNQDCTCCYQTPSGCGQIPIPPQYINNNGTYSIPNNPNSNGSCYLGQELLANQCGNGSSCGTQSSSCVNGANLPGGNISYNCPLPTCTGIADPTAVACPGNMTTGFSQNLTYSYVSNQAACISPAQCEYYCPSGLLNPNGPGCLNPVYAYEIDFEEGGGSVALRASGVDQADFVFDQTPVSRKLDTVVTWYPPGVNPVGWSEIVTFPPGVTPHSITMYIADGNYGDVCLMNDCMYCPKEQGKYDRTYGEFIPTDPNGVYFYPGGEWWPKTWNQQMLVGIKKIDLTTGNVVQTLLTKIRRTQASTGNCQWASATISF